MLQGIPREEYSAKILTILKDAFGERATNSELITKFYQCKQDYSETLRDFRIS